MTFLDRLAGEGEGIGARKGNGVDSKNGFFFFSWTSVFLEKFY